MQQYLNLLSRISLSGYAKHPSREESGKTVNPTIGLPNLHFSHDLRTGFPLLTTRKINYEGMVGELRSFLLGQTDNKDFVANGCKFWTPWAGKATHKASREQFGTAIGDLGPIYGFQWKAHGQLDHVLYCLRNHPTDRRMVVCAWRRDEHQYMALPPCHVMWIVTIYNNTVNLSWFQRSCDFPLGVPYNIASYALLTHLLAAWAGMEVGSLDCIFCDAHIYANQIDGVAEQLKRIPTSLPQVKVTFDNPDDFDSWQVQLFHWKPQTAIDMGTPEV